MPRIDPLQLLTCLNVLLAKNGGVLSQSEVKRLAGLMVKYSKKLVSKCIYIQILKCTQTDLLGEFMGAGGWTLTHMWLNDGIRAMNWPLVQEILELLLLCPVDVQRLKTNSAPKLVKQLSKDGGNEGVKIYATRLVEQWLNVVKGETKVNFAEQANLLGTFVTTTATNTTNTTKTTIQIGNTSIINMNINNTEHILLTKGNSICSSSVGDVINDIKIISPMKSDIIINNNNTINAAAGAGVKLPRKLSIEPKNVYQIMLKDGKQILSKVDNSTINNTSATIGQGNLIVSTIPSKSTESTESTDKTALGQVDFIDCGGATTDLKEIEDVKFDDKENNKKKDIKEKSMKNTTSSSNSTSSSSKDKRRSSSSSSTHKTSSSKSSSSTSATTKSSSSSRNSNSKSKSSSSSSSTRHHRSSSDSGKSRDCKERTDRHKSSSSRSTNSSSSKSSSSHKEKSSSSGSGGSRDKEKEKAEQIEKDKETLSKILPTSIEKLGKIPKKPRDPNDKSAATVQPTSITIPSKKASMSIEIRRDSEKTKTVKTYKSQFRSHGLNEEAPPPPSRKNLKKPSSLSLPGTSIPNSMTTSTTGSASSNSFSLKRSSSSPLPPASASTTTSNDSNKDGTTISTSTGTGNEGASAEKKSKIDLSNLPNNIIEKPGAIKLIPPKPKPASLVESDMFMDALFASAAPKKDIRKRKRQTSGSKETASPVDSPVTVKATPLKFYQDTLEEKDDTNKSDSDGTTNAATRHETKDKNESDAKGKLEGEEDDDIPLKKVKEDIELKCRREGADDDSNSRTASNHDDDDDIEMGEPIKKPPGPGCGPDGPPGVLMLHRRRGPKKQLQWRPQDQLEEIRFFELDETERVNVTKTFTDMKQMERCGEREAFIMARKLNNEDVMVEQTPWSVLIICDDVPTHPDGSQSKEKKVQAEREQSTLKALYFSRAMIPDSASEPDMEHYQSNDPAVIPLDDITGNPDAVNDYVNYGWPEPKGTPPRIQEENNLHMHGILGRGINESDMKFSNNQFNPFMPFCNNNQQQQNGVWGMAVPGGGPSMVGVPNNGPPILPPNLMSGPVPNPFTMPNNMQPNIMIASVGPPMSPDSMNMSGMGGGIVLKNPLMQGFGPIGPNFGPPNGMMGQQMAMGMGGNNNNFGGGGPQINMNGMIANMNMNGGPIRGMNQNNNNNRNGNGGGGGNWRSGGPPNLNNNNNGNNGGGGGNNWRSGSSNNNQRAWIHGNSNNNGRGICKQFMRGFCRNGNKCIYVHPGPSNRI